MAPLAYIYRKNIYSTTDWGEECRGFPLQNAVSAASELESPPETGLLLVVLLTIFYFASTSCWIFFACLHLRLSTFRCLLLPPSHSTREGILGFHLQYSITYLIQKILKLLFILFVTYFIICSTLIITFYFLYLQKTNLNKTSGQTL
mgnify:CR=1 FL=1